MCLGPTRFSDGAVLYPEVAPWQFGSPFFLASGTKSITSGFWVADLNGDGDRAQRHRAGR